VNRILRAALRAGNIREVLSLSLKRIGVELDVLRNRRELRGNLGDNWHQGRGGFSPFEENIRDLNWDDSRRNAEMFWGGRLDSRSQNDALRDFISRPRWEDLSGDQQWSRTIDRSLRQGPWTDTGYFKDRYNPFPDNPLRTGGNADNIPPDWRSSGNPVRADGIEILPWDRYKRMPIEVRKYADPFFNSPMFNSPPIIDINRNYGR
jgi:hypothetical protein